MMVHAHHVLLLCLAPAALLANDQEHWSWPDEADVCNGDDLACALSLRQLRGVKGEGALDKAQASEQAGEDSEAALMQAALLGATSAGKANVTLEDLPAAATVAAPADPMASDDAELATSLEASLGAKPGGGAGGIITVYHQTSPEIGASILREGFRPGHGGWCGGAIYFAVTPQATYWKAIASTSHHGFIIAARVKVGRVKHMSRKCYGGLNGGLLRKWGYDSIRFNPGDGDEVVIYDSSRILSMKEIHIRPPGPNERPYYAFGR